MMRVGAQQMILGLHGPATDFPRQILSHLPHDDSPPDERVLDVIWAMWAVRSIGDGERLFGALVRAYAKLWAAEVEAVPNPANRFIVSLTTMQTLDLPIPAEWLGRMEQVRRLVRDAARPIGTGPVTLFW